MTGLGRRGFRTRRNLLWFRRAHLAVTLGAAVASTVLTGALLAGDSLRGSLRDLALARLGRIDRALVAPGLFREALAGEESVPALLLGGSAAHAATGTRAAGVTVLGVDERFAALFPSDRGGGLDLRRRGGQLFPSVALNGALARELGAGIGDPVLLTFALPGDVPRETLLGRRAAEHLLATRRFVVAALLSDRGAGGFALTPHQAAPRNAFVSLAELQQGLGRERMVNALFAPRPVRLRPRLEDLGLRLRRGPAHLSLESRGFFLDEEVVREAEALAHEVGLPSRRVLTYLATRIERPSRPAALVPYSLVAGLSSFAGLGREPGPGEVLLNEWAAADLGVRPGDAVRFSYLLPAAGGGLRSAQTTLRLAGIVPRVGLGADPSLTPAVRGLEEADDVAAWDPPFPVDLSLVRPRDEEYWDRHRAAPKAFVSEATARRLWSTRFGSVTAVRLEASPGEVAAGRLDAAARRLAAELPRRVDRARFGLVFRPVRRQALAAAEGSTDFAGLFLAFSSFLIAAAALLAGLLFRLGVERRARELGLLLAVGFPLRAVRRGLLAEGAVLAGLGALLGLAGALGYAALLLLGLRTLWLPAVGTPHLALHVAPASLAVGWLAALAVVLAVVAWMVRRLARLPAPALLAGSTRPPDTQPRRGRRRLLLLAAGTSAVGGGLLIAGAVAGGEASPALAFSVGAAALAGGLALVAAGLRPRVGAAPPRRTFPRPGLLALAARNAAAYPGRSLLAVTLLACACFVLVVVAASRAELSADTTGGLPLYAEADIPPLHDLGTPAGRAALGLTSDEGALRDLAVVPFRLRPGEDASCLNLFRPSEPRLLGVPQDRSRLAGLRFARTLDPGPARPADLWSLLDLRFASGPDGAAVVPAIADANSAQWILHLGLGEDLVLRDETGSPLRLRLVGTLARSVFQGELLVAEERLLAHFPSVTGRRVFLLDAPPGRQAAATAALEQGLGRFGFDVTPAAERLAGYLAVERTYLATFGTLGGLGLLLGTLGMAVVLVRNVEERRGELAALRAFGFPRRRLAWMVAAENAVLLSLGILLGTVAGLLAAAPRLLAAGERPGWAALAATLAAVFLVGLAASAAAVRSALAAPLLPVLKAER